MEAALDVNKDGRFDDKDVRVFVKKGLGVLSEVGAPGLPQSALLHGHGLGCPPHPPTTPQGCM